MKKYETSDQTRQSLIEATGQLASEKGFGAISTRDIAKRADANIGSIHYHFGSKEKLFEAVVHTVARRWQDNSLEALLAQCDLTCKKGQAEAIRRTITREADLLFDKEMPAWHSRVAFQVMQYANNLRDTLRAIVFDPEYEQLGRMLKAIDPDMDEETVILNFGLLFSPFLLHANYQSAILQRLDKTEYSRDYLQHLVVACIEQTLRRFNLPLE